MDIHSKEGTEITVTESSIKNGYDHVENHAREHLKVGEIYTVEKTEVSNWTTSVFLKEFPGEIFNSVSFRAYNGKIYTKADMKQFVEFLLAEGIIIQEEGKPQSLDFLHDVWSGKNPDGLI